MAVTMALFTRDLRVHDNPVLVAAAKNGNSGPAGVPAKCWQQLSFGVGGLGRPRPELI